MSEIGRLNSVPALKGLNDPRFMLECLHAETLNPGSHSANYTDLPLRVHDDCALYNPHTVCHINS